MKKFNYILIISMFLLINIECKKTESEYDIQFGTGISIINKIIPNDGESFSIFDAPKVEFNIQINTQSENSNGIVYQSVLDTFSVENSIGEHVPGIVVLSEDNLSAIYVPNEFFSIGESYKIKVVAHYESLVDGEWVIYENDNLVNEDVVSFIADENAPPTIDDLILSVYPEEGSSNVSIYNNTELICKYPFNTTIPLYYSGKEHRLNFVDYIISYSGNQISGDIDINDNIVSFFPNDTLPSNQHIEQSIKMFWEVKTDNGWKPFFSSGDTLFAEYTSSFSTENYIHTGVIDSANIEYSYPIDRQYHFLKNESPTGYVKLKFQQDDIYESKSWSFIARYTSPGLETIDVDIDYNEEDLLFSFPVPSSQLENETIYKLTFIQVFKKTKEENPFYELYFRTSQFNSFEEKWSSFDYARWSWGAGNGLHKIGIQYVLTEKFDYFENRSLTKLEGQTNNEWYQNHVYPLLYEGYPNSGLYLNRTIEPYGLPPLNFFTKYNDGPQPILTDLQITNNNAPEPTINSGYISYFIESIVYEDYMDLKNQIQEIPEENRTDWMMNLLNSSYPYLIAGYPNSINYHVKLKYMITPEISTFETIIPFGY